MGIDRGVLCSDEEDDPFWLEEESHPGDEGHQFPAALPDRANGGRAGALELNLADDPELARLGGIPPAERVFMYLQVRLSLSSALCCKIDCCSGRLYTCIDMCHWWRKCRDREGWRGIVERLLQGN